MTYFFISDLHLNAHETVITRLFYRFTELLKSNDTLYILGDFFNLWVGDDAISDFDKKIQEHLSSLIRNNIKIYMLYGNRDFLMKESFFKSTGITFLKDESVITLNGIKTLIMHGDSLCSDDKNYLRYKRIVRNSLVQRCFLSLPTSLRYRIAEKLRQNSQKQFDRTTMLIDVTQNTVIETMKKHQVSQLIHGHTHIPGIHHFEINHQPATRIVLGAWHNKGSVLKVSSKGVVELTEFQ